MNVFKEHSYSIKSKPPIKLEFEVKCSSVEEDFVLEDYQLIKLEDTVKVEEMEYSPAGDKITFDADEEEVADYHFDDYQLINLEGTVKVEKEDYSPAEDKKTFDADEEEVADYPFDELSSNSVDPLGNSDESYNCWTSSHSLINNCTEVSSEEDKQAKKEEIESSTSEKLSYLCYHCLYKASDKETFICHIRREHLESTELKSKDIKYYPLLTGHPEAPPFSCPHCEFSCNLSISLKKHIKAKHIGERPFSCPHCEYSCTRPSHLKKHVEAKHPGERPFSCPHCEYSCTQSSHLKKHVEAKHPGHNGADYPVSWPKYEGMVGFF